jgi:hypothetical protein
MGTKTISGIRLILITSILFTTTSIAASHQSEGVGTNPINSELHTLVESVDPCRKFFFTVKDDVQIPVRAKSVYIVARSGTLHFDPSTIANNVWVALDLDAKTSPNLLKKGSRFPIEICKSGKSRILKPGQIAGIRSQVVRISGKVESLQGEDLISLLGQIFSWEFL